MAFSAPHAAIARAFIAKTATPEACAANFPKTIDAVKALAESAKTDLTTNLEVIYTAPPTFKDVARLLDATRMQFGVSTSLLSVLKQCAVEKEVRETATKALVDLSAFAIDNLSSNRRLYRCLEAVQGQDPAFASLPPTLAYWYDQTIKEFKRSGMHLDDENLAKVVAIQKQISEFSTNFSTNCAEDKTQREFTEEELQGVPASNLENLSKTEDGTKRILKMDYPTYFAVMKNCEVASTRLTMAKAFENRGYPANVEVLHKVISLRHQVAQLLGFKSYSEYDLENKMAGDPAVAYKFIDDLVPGLQKKWQDEKKLLLEDLHPSVVLTENGEIPFSDVAFCMNRFKDKFLQVNETKIQEYFPLDSTITALFSIYEKFFDIKFEKFESTDLYWHPSVTVLTATDNKSGKVLGHIACDLFPREGKYSHACCHGTIPVVEQEDGSFSPAFCVVVANFPKATETRPALLMHDDVETFFHEFGHAIHGLMGRCQMSTHAGTRVKRDFVELPSQMLEEWMWENSVLQSSSQHYETKEPLPKDLIAAKIRSKTAFSGRDSLRQLQFATYALKLFDSEFASKPIEQMDAAGLYKDICPGIMPGIAYNQETQFPCNFEHLMGYAATYYGYMWSEVFAQDVFEYIRSRDGLLSPELGARYVKYVIGPGGSRDPNDMLADFLERKPNSDAFVKKLGLSA